MPPEIPVFGICGHSGSGRTTLIEALLPVLVREGLSVALAGVDGPDKESPARVHEQPGKLGDLARRHDLVLCEGKEGLDCAKVWLLAEGESAPPEEARAVLATLGRDGDRVQTVRGILDEWLPRRWRETPVYGCVLIGGESRRMGTPKHLLPRGERTWVEDIVACLARASERVVIVGAGELPDGLADAARLPDAPGVGGPMAGLLAAMRWAPEASWLVSACDLPKVSADAFNWLLSTRGPGVWATLPKLPGGEGVEPLLAHYAFRARALLEALASEGRFSPSLLAGQAKVISPTPPDRLIGAWENVNTPEDLRGLA